MSPPHGAVATDVRAVCLVGEGPFLPPEPPGGGWSDGRRAARPSYGSHPITVNNNRAPADTADPIVRGPLDRQADVAASVRTAGPDLSTCDHGPCRRQPGQPRGRAWGYWSPGLAFDTSARAPAAIAAVAHPPLPPGYRARCFLH